MFFPTEDSYIMIEYEWIYDSFSVETSGHISVCCFSFAASCMNQPFSHHDQPSTPQAANSSGDEPIRSLPI